MLQDPRAVLIDGPAGPLETLFQEPESRGEEGLAALIAHPHPLHGGTMHNKVVHRAAKALRGAGVPVLRFNFRGVGKSGGRHDDGRGEQDDFRAALDHLATLRPGRPLVAAGFSFGSRVAILAGGADPRVVGLIGLGVPLKLYPDLPAALARVTRPMVILQGLRDEFTTAAELRMAIAHLPRPPLVFDLPGDHFFDEGLDMFGTILPWFVGRLLNPKDSVDDRDPRL